MRPLLHPLVEEMTVEGILYALADPVRVRIFTDLLASTCAQNCTALANLNATPMPKSTLSQHFKILREAGLIRSERRGVELQNRPRWDEYGKKFGPMISGIIEAYSKELTARAGHKTARVRRA
jgi:DNA-binding transcriptional ArsR family regulator